MARKPGIDSQNGESLIFHTQKKRSLHDLARVTTDRTVEAWKIDDQSC